MNRIDLNSNIRNGKYYLTAKEIDEFDFSKTSSAQERIEIAKIKNARQTALQNLFKQDALEVLGLSDHPKGDILFKLAWEFGHSNGFTEVWLYMQDFAELLK